MLDNNNNNNNNNNNFVCHCRRSKKQSVQEEDKKMEDELEEDGKLGLGSLGEEEVKEKGLFSSSVSTSSNLSLDVFKTSRVCSRGASLEQIHPSALRYAPVPSIFHFHFDSVASLLVVQVLGSFK